MNQKILIVFLSVMSAGVVVGTLIASSSNLFTLNPRAQVKDTSQKQGTAGEVDPTVRPTNLPTLTLPPAQITKPPVVAGPVPVTTPKIGGPNSQDYCIDDEDPDMCDDNSSHLVPKGVGGVAASCGTVIEQTHKLVAALPQVMKGLRNSLSKTISNCGYSTGPASGYVSTHLVIDAYNLAGHKELSKNDASQVSPSGMFSWWQATTGYEFVPYSTSVIQQFGEGKRDLTGCVMFLKTSSSYHIGIVNKFELFTPGGDGVISILQSGTRMYIDRFPVSGWNVSNSSTNQTTTSGVAGFGCHS
jgi:hypothetical protein